MMRSDLPPGYGGWQVVDATPQEESGGKYQTGPSPVVAVKRGQSIGFDTDFVIAEVRERDRERERERERVRERERERKKY